MDMSSLRASNKDHLFQMILSSDKDAQSWVKFMVTAESAIAVAYGYGVTTFVSTLVTMPNLLLYLTAFCAVSGIFVAVITCLIIRRVRQWHAWYIEKYQEYSGVRGAVFPVPENNTARIAKRNAGYLARQIMIFSFAIVAAWIAVLCFVASHNDFSLPIGAVAGHVAR